MMISLAIPVLTFSAYILLFIFQPEGMWSVVYLKNKFYYFSAAFFIWFSFYFVNTRIRFVNYPNFRRLKHIRYESALYAVLAAGFMGFLFFFRTNRFFPPPYGNGDSLILLEHIPVYAELFGYLDSLDEVLTLYVYSKLYLFLKGLFQTNIRTSIALASIAAGGIYFFFFLRFIKNLNRKFFPAISLIILTPALELFAGYIENYTISSLFISLSLFQGILLLNEKSPPYKGDSGFIHEKRLFLISLFSAFAFLFHILGGLLFFALVYLVRKRSKNFRSFIKLSAAASVPAILLIAVTWSYFLFFSENPVAFTESFMLNPPFLRPSKALSVQNVLNFVNYIILSSPFAIPILIYYYYENKENSPGHLNNSGHKNILKTMNSIIGFIAPQPEHKFLLIASISYILLIFIHNPLIGLPADWDLHSFFHIPLNLYLFSLLSYKNRPSDAARRSFIAAAFILNFFMTFSWMLFHSGTSSESLKNLAMTEVNTTELLENIHDDQTFRQIKDLSRKKIYVKVILFDIRAENFLNEMLHDTSVRLFPHEKKAIENMLLSLHKEKAAFQSLVLLPDDEYKKKLPDIWKNLSSINTRISDLQIKKYETIRDDFSITL